MSCEWHTWLGLAAPRNDPEREKDLAIIHVRGARRARAVLDAQYFLTANRILVEKRLKNKGTLTITSYAPEGEI